MKFHKKILSNFLLTTSLSSLLAPSPGTREPDGKTKSIFVHARGMAPFRYHRVDGGGIETVLSVSETVSALSCFVFLK
jgi:hypothetical protein